MKLKSSFFFYPLGKRFHFHLGVFTSVDTIAIKGQTFSFLLLYDFFLLSLSIHLLFWMNVVLWNRFQVLFFFLNGKEFLHSWYTFEIRTIHQSEKILLYLRKVNDVFTGAAAAKKSIWGKSLNTQK